MITVFHGDDIVRSRKAFLEALETARSEKKETSCLDGKKMTTTDFSQALESKSLFNNEREVFIENLLSINKSKEKEKLFEILKKNINASVFVWEEKELNKTQQEGWGKEFSFQIFKLPAVIFSFLDSLVPGNPKINLKGFHYCLKNNDPEMIFGMLIRQIRLLILSKEGEQFLPGASWQKSKLLKQAKLFSLEKLKTIYKKLLEIDYQQKTSQLSLDLSFSLDLLLEEI